MGSEINVRIKLFSGIDKELKLEKFDPGEGVVMKVPSGKRLKWALKNLGIVDVSRNVYFRNGQRISAWAKLKDGDEVTCLRASGGG